MAKVNHIDGNIINDSIKLFENGAKSIMDIRLAVERKTNSVLETWSGESANEFEYQYEILNQQIKDIEDELYDFYDDLVKGYSGYLEADNELSNNIKNKK